MMKKAIRVASPQRFAQRVLNRVMEASHDPISAVGIFLILAAIVIGITGSPQFGIVVGIGALIAVSLIFGWLIAGSVEVAIDGFAGAVVAIAKFCIGAVLSIVIISALLFLAYIPIHFIVKYW